MAGGYKPQPDGVEGLAAKFKDLQRQLDALRASAGITSAIVRGKSLEFQNDAGDVIARYGQFEEGHYEAGEFLHFDTVTGAAFYDPATTAPILFAVANEHGETIFQAGDADNLAGLDYFAAFANQAQLQTSTFIALDAATTVNLRADTRVFIRGTEGIDIQAGADLHIYNLSTTGAAANLRQDQVDGEILCVVSSARYKQDIEDAQIDPDAFLKLRPRTWRDRGQVRKDPTTKQRHVGFIAEEVAELGLPFVDYDAKGRPDSLQYDRFMAGAVQVMKKQQTQIDEQAKTIAALTKRLDTLEATARTKTTK